MNKITVGIFICLLSFPVIADEETLSSHEVKECIEMSENYDDKRETRKHHENRIREAERVIRSYGCYNSGNTWRCSGLTPEQEFNVKTTIDAKNRSASIYNRLTSEIKRLTTDYNSQCGSGFNVRVKDVDRYCKHNNTYFCRDARN